MRRAIAVARVCLTGTEELLSQIDAGSGATQALLLELTLEEPSSRSRSTMATRPGGRVNLVDRVSQPLQEPRLPRGRALPPPACHLGTPSRARHRRAR